MQAIPLGTTDDNLRTIKFRVMTLADPLAPKTSGVAGTKAKLAFGNGSPADSDNDIAAVNAATGHYQLTLSDDEVANPVPGLLSYDAATCASVDRYFQIGASTLLEETATPEEIAAAVNDDAVVRIKGTKRTGANGNGGISIPLSSGTATGVLATNAAARPITEFDTGS